MSIATEHPQYTRIDTARTDVLNAIAGQDTIKAARERYLPKTSGMRKNDTLGHDYSSYLMRARFPELTLQALSGIVGLLFEQDPEGANESPITHDGKGNVALAREVVRAICGAGRDVLAVDAPVAPAGGTPFIARYTAANLPNWKVDPANPGRLTLAILREADQSGQSLYGHESETIYRRYQQLRDQVVITRWQVVNERDVQIGQPLVLPVSQIPIIIPGSIDLMPDQDPIPLLPVVRCCLSYYLKSACYEQALYLSSQPTPTVSGIDETQYQAILEQGIGSSALWYLGENGHAGFLQAMGEPGALERAMQKELEMAESFAVRLTQNEGAEESGRARALRAATQHASIYSMADAVSQAITLAQNVRSGWAGESTPEPFRLRTDFGEAAASEHMINALNATINAGNAPRAVMFEAVRKAGYSQLTDEQMQDQIRRDGPPGQAAA